MSLRPATRIKELAEEGLQAIKTSTPTERQMATARSCFAAIDTLATNIDARTGTTDPSKKKGRISAAIDALLGR